MSTTSDKQKIRCPQGTKDLLPADRPAWCRLEQVGRETFEMFGYSEIRTPIFEDTGLFVRGIGEATDIVEKEMYTIAEEDRSSVTLRPEATASVVRAYLQHEFPKAKKFQKLYYIGPMFRRERPQAGRLRQFHQMGIEALGSYDALLDAETIILAASIFERAGLSGCRVRINSIGCRECRPQYRQVLRQALAPRRGELCEVCQRRFERNVFRILDCKNKRCRAIRAGVPSPTDHLCECCDTHFGSVGSALDNAGAQWEHDSAIVRGLDYYTKTVYEISHPSLGARDVICGGGRYDHLVEEIGGPPTGAVGFAIGIEATLLALQNSGALATEEADGQTLDVYVVAISDECRSYCFDLVSALRVQGVSADLDYEGRSTKAQMRSANKLGARTVAVVGPDEMASQRVTLKNMEAGDEQQLPRDEAVAVMAAQ